MNQVPVKKYLVKVQTVTTIPVECVPETRKTLGNTIDDILRDFEADGHVPNKLVIDLNPTSVDPANVEST